MMDRMMMDRLPSEITTQILSLLPVRSVFVCRSVCKTWRNLIDDRRFAQLQFTKSLQFGNEDNKLITSFLFLPSISHGNDDDAFYVVDLAKENTNTFKTTKIRFSSCPSNFSYKFCDQLFYVNGLLCFCLQQDGCRICLCNPATQDWVDLTNSESYFQRGFGFGFDHNHKNFKLPVIDCCLGVSGESTTEARVFTSGSNSWRDLKNVPQVMCSSYSATVQGSIHWFIHNNGVLSIRILSFNLYSESFGFYDLPKDYLGAEVDANGFHIMNYGEDLAVVNFSNYDRLEVWVMKEYSVKESWTKLTVMKRDVVTGVEYIQLFPISPWKDGEILLLNESSKLVSYNFESGRYTLFQINGLPRDEDFNDGKKHYFYDAYPYVGNLLSVQPTEYNNNQYETLET